MKMLIGAVIFFFVTSTANATQSCERLYSVFSIQDLSSLGYILGHDVETNEMAIAKFSLNEKTLEVEIDTKTAHFENPVMGAVLANDQFDEIYIGKEYIWIDFKNKQYMFSY